MFKLVWALQIQPMFQLKRGIHSNSNSKEVGPESYLGTPSSKSYGLLLRFGVAAKFALVLWFDRSSNSRLQIYISDNCMKEGGQMFPYIR
jgi:hypothetical protein